jgi:sulfite reductase beta subunit-like hemoprotein
MRVHWSGCPHACGQHRIGDIGFQGARVRIGDEIVDAVDVYLGGRLGANPALAEKVADNVPLTELPGRLRDLLSEREQNAPLASGACPGQGRTEEGPKAKAPLSEIGEGLGVR